MATATTPESGNVEDVLADRLQAHGIVVLPEPLPTDFVAELRDAFQPLAEEHVSGAEPNRGTSRHQMFLPFEAPFSDPALWANPTVLGILEHVLGPDFECIYYGADTPYPGSERQPVHQDGQPLFPEWENRPPTYCVALNVPLVDVDDDNGPLEWFASDDRPGPDIEPERFTGSAGTVLLRDTRVWHRGSPNISDRPRPMLALLYARPWYRFPLARPVIDRPVYQRLPDPGRRLFQAADITPTERPTAGRSVFGRDDS